MADEISPATTDDLPGLLALLEAAGLPTAGLTEHLGGALVARAAGRVTGGVALELYGEEALLRSLAVLDGARGRGIGDRLVRSAIDLARRRGVRRIWLLTTTAERYFRFRGFRAADRADLPEALGASEELRCACPASATAMWRTVAATVPAEPGDSAG
jgi:N-acetylglutamate synthase-like GNAT family acetyltransferase